MAQCGTSDMYGRAGVDLVGRLRRGRLMGRAGTLVLALWLGAAGIEPDASRPLPAIADGRLTGTRVAGQGALPILLSADWSRRQADVRRVLIFIPDASRDADLSLRLARAARYAGGEAAPGTMLVVPQFLADRDLARHRVAPDVLRWSM